MSGLRVVGLDLSLTSTGMSDGVETRVVQTGASEQMEARLDRITQRVWHYVVSADLVVIEGSSFGSRGPGHEELAALRLMVRTGLWKLGIPFAMVPPTTLKKYLTSHGGATKQLVVASVDARYGLDLTSFKVRDGRYDRADALGLAAMGHDHVGQPLPEWDMAAKPHRASLESVAWPELYSDDA